MNQWYECCFNTQVKKYKQLGSAVKWMLQQRNCDPQGDGYIYERGKYEIMFIERGRVEWDTLGKINTDWIAWMEKEYAT